MTNIHTLEDIATLSETLVLECKLAAGRDGKGQLPADFWPTYSAFANSRGGIILLGVQEKQGHFSLQGVDQPERIITDLFNTVNNPQKVSIKPSFKKTVLFRLINGIRGRKEMDEKVLVIS